MRTGRPPRSRAASSLNCRRGESRPPASLVLLPPARPLIARLASAPLCPNTNGLCVRIPRAGSAGANAAGAGAAVPPLHWSAPAQPPAAEDLTRLSSPIRALWRLETISDGVCVCGPFRRSVVVLRTALPAICWPSLSTRSRAAGVSGSALRSETPSVRPRWLPPALCRKTFLRRKKASSNRF